MADPRAGIRWLVIDPVAQCNLQCCACNHFAPYAEPHIEPTESLVQELSLLGRHAHARELHVSGGEPLLHPDIGALLRALRRTGVPDRIRLQTNGLLLHRACPELWDEVDILHVSLYPGFEDRVDLEEATQNARRTATVLRVTHRPLFRETIGDAPHGDRALTRSVFRTCLFKDLCHAYRGGRLYRCVQAALAYRRLERVGLSRETISEDGLLIEDRSDMADRIRAYLASREPLQTCACCFGMVGRIVEHRQLHEQEIDGPRPGGREELLDAAELKARLRAERLGRWLGFLPRRLRRSLGLVPTFRPMAPDAARGPRLEQLWPPPAADQKADQIE